MESCRLRWAVDTEHWAPSPSELDFLLSLLPENERAESTRFKFLADRKRHLVSRLLGRAAAHAALGLPHAAVLVRRTRGGKPYVANELAKPQAPNYNYSISHEARGEGPPLLPAVAPVHLSAANQACGVPLGVRRRAACPVAPGSLRLGWGRAPDLPRAPRAAPVEQVRRRAAEPLSEFFRSFRDQFTPAEWASIHALAPDEVAQEGQFRKLWSLKEAFIKAIGLGLEFELIKAEFAVDGSAAALTIEGAPAPRWAFRLHELGGSHWVSVARGPLDAVVDRWGGFKATFQKASFSEEEWAAVLAAPEPPFALLSVADLVPETLRAAYAAAGGDAL
eukprot:scaffold13.g188.t1